MVTETAGQTLADHSAIIISKQPAVLRGIMIELTTMTTILSISQGNAMFWVSLASISVVILSTILVGVPVIPIRVGMVLVLVVVIRGVISLRSCIVVVPRIYLVNPLVLVGPRLICLNPLRASVSPVAIISVLAIAMKMVPISIPILSQLVRLPWRSILRGGVRISLSSIKGSVPVGSFGSTILAEVVVQRIHIFEQGGG